MEPNGWEIFQFIGAVLAVVLTILTFGGHIASLLKSTRRWMARVWISCIEKRLFRKYKPSWEIVDSGNVEMLREGTNYRIRIPIQVKFKSRDARYETTVYLNQVKILLQHKKDDRERLRYELRESLPSMAIPPLGEHTVSFVFMKAFEAQPLIDMNSQVEYIVYLGEAVINGISGIRSLGVSNKRTAQVIQGVGDENDK